MFTLDDTKKVKIQTINDSTFVITFLRVIFPRDLRLSLFDLTAFCFSLTSRLALCQSFIHLFVSLKILNSQSLTVL